jgi:hypothetical protein
MPFSP